MKNILVMDDNKYILDALTACICRSLKDCRVLTAVNGAKGSDILCSRPIDLILTDLDMPAEDGYRFIEKARKDHPSVLLYVMSGRCAEHVRERLHRLGVRRVIEKPFSPETLVGLISEDLRLESQNVRQGNA